MAITKIQQAGAPGQPSQYYVRVTLGSDVTVGNVVIVTVITETAVDFTTCSDNLSHTWTEHLDGGGSVKMFSTVVATAGSMTITVNASWSGENHGSIVASEWSGIDTSDRYEAGNVTGEPWATGNSNTDGLVSGNITPSNDGCLIIASGYQLWTTPTLGTGWSNVLANRQRQEYKIQATAAQINATWTGGSTNGWGWVIAAFNPDPAVTKTPTVGSLSIAGGSGRMDLGIKPPSLVRGS